MQETEHAVDVISVCSADGRIRPLRLQLEDAQQQRQRIDIAQILSTKEIPYTGAEAIIFLCRGDIEGHSFTFRLKYLFRQHSWRLL